MTLLATSLGGPVCLLHCEFISGSCPKIKLSKNPSSIHDTSALQTASLGGQVCLVICTHCLHSWIQWILSRQKAQPTVLYTSTLTCAKDSVLLQPAHPDIRDDVSPTAAGDKIAPNYQLCGEASLTVWVGGQEMRQIFSANLEFYQSGKLDEKITMYF